MCSIYQQISSQSVSQWQLSYLFHLLSKSGEDFITFCQSALELLKLVHVQGELNEEARVIIIIIITTIILCVIFIVQGNACDSLQIKSLEFFQFGSKWWI